MIDLPIDEAWLKEVGFKWHQLERQTSKHWLLWLGAAVRSHDDSLTDDEDIGIEVAAGIGDRGWFCWLRSDAAGRYHRFIHLRHLHTRTDLIRIVEAISGFQWNPENHLYGGVKSPAQARRIREGENRMDRELRREGHPWAEIEKDDTRGRALPDHLEAHEKAKPK